MVAFVLVEVRVFYMARVKIDRKICQGCGNCVAVCPYGIERRMYESGFDSCRVENADEVICVVNGVACVVRPELCSGCRYRDCVKVCPSGALKIETVGGK
nr:4Fe-4S binding protein [Candidatus Freyarchaeota archaeon]